jgi:hypothetical protein
MYGRSFTLRALPEATLRPMSAPCNPNHCLFFPFDFQLSAVNLFLLNSPHAKIKIPHPTG